MNNPIGIISMQFVRPFTARHLPLLRQIRELGFDFIELLVPEPEDGLDPREFRRAAGDAGLDIVLAARVNPSRSIASADESARRGGHEYLLRCIDMADALGARIIGGPLYGEPLVFAGRAPQPWSEAQMEERARRMIDGLGAVAPRAADAGKVLALEALNRFETDMVNTTRQAVQVVDAVGSPGLGLVLDTFHMNMEDPSIPDAIRLAGNRIVHFQANENHRGFPGTGHVDGPPILRVLAETGYGGPVSLEPFRREDDRIALPIAHWRAPAVDESAKLRAAVRFVRSLMTMAEHAQ